MKCCVSMMDTEYSFGMLTIGFVIRTKRLLFKAIPTDIPVSGQGFFAGIDAGRRVLSNLEIR